MFLPTAAVRASVPDNPTRVLIIVLDQTRRDTITRYDMDNVKGLARRGVSFPNAYLGHMAAETVITHNVLTSGQLPKHMGWSNEVHRDVGNVLGQGSNAYHVSSSMGCSQFDALITNAGYMKLQNYLDAEFGTSTFASIAEKRTAACSAGQSAGDHPEDFIFQIRGSSSVTEDCLADIPGTETWRLPELVNPPPLGYISLGPCSQWQTRQSNTPPLDYGTASIPPAHMYPLEGNRFMPGTDAGHVGGDTWSANAAIEVIENDPNWHGMMVSLGAIDKAGHMWGPDDRGQAGGQPETHLPFLAKLADTQVGRIVAALDAQGQLDETLIVITADHGAQTGKNFYGINQPLRSDFNWYYGVETTTGTNEDYRQPSPAIQGLVTDLGSNLGFSYQDSHVAVWLNDQSLVSLQAGAVAVRKLPKVVAAYYRDGDHYVLHGSVANMPVGEKAWFDLHAQELLDTMAAPGGPDVVGLLRNKTTYGVYGDHGGHQRLVQDVPIIFSWPGLKPGQKPPTALRSVDIMPTILQLMGISFVPSSMDGVAFTLPRK